MKIRYDYHTDSIGEMDEADIPASMAAVETAIRAAYPTADVEITRDAGRVNPVAVDLTDAEIEAGLYDETIAGHVQDIANTSWSKY